jgi:hypothetical protein
MRTIAASFKEQSGEILLMAYVYNYIILEKNASLKEQSGEILTMADVYNYIILEKKLSVSTVHLLHSYRSYCKYKYKMHVLC